MADSQRVNLSVDRKYFGLVGKFNHQGREVRLLIPTTYMNRSGQSVAALANFFKIKPEEILVAHDELDMPPGIAKLKQGGGHGGHNGLRDIIAQLGNQNNFHRLRLGIGHPGHASLVSGYVLGRAPRSEQELLDQSIDFALGVLPDILAGDWTRAMQKLHSQKATK
ncbi:peptidyl-tRNA hydrolase [Pseudomonas sp. EGD-AK9]|nr:peptidyl-tRNA hydrolase [Pseudomonas sp. EGD-AK9]